MQLYRQSGVARASLTLWFLFGTCESVAHGQALPIDGTSMQLRDGASAAMRQPLRAGPQSSAEVSSNDLEQMSLEELLDMKVDVASKKAKSLRETPGIVTIITREEIINSGARDLVDVLRLVPGFDFGVDTANIIGPGFRGNWGFEGKILLMIDGQVMNETFYGTNQFGCHYPLNDIKMIEVIRGPGSTSYGGFAELAVINVVLRDGSDVGGVGSDLVVGQMGKQTGRSTLQVYAGQRFKSAGDLDLRISGYAGRANRSTETYRSITGDQYTMAWDNAMDPVFVNGALKYQGLRVRFIYDNFKVANRDAATSIQPKKYTDFISILADASYDLKLRPTITLSPVFSFKRQIPWRHDEGQVASHFVVTTDRYTLRVPLTYDILDNLNWLIGAEYYYDRAAIGSSSGGSSGFELGGKQSVGYHNITGFTELLWDTIIGNLLAGLRYEYNNLYGSSFMPRAAFTKAFKQFHAKLLFSQAFKAPDIANIITNEDIKPERTTIFEVELGAQILKELFFRVNVFDIIMKDPIIYYSDPTRLVNGYRNASDSGTWGCEAELRFAWRGYSAMVNYSFYTTAGKHINLSDYTIPGRSDLLLGFPAHKLAFSAQLNPIGKLNINPSLVFMSERYGATGIDANRQFIVSRIKPEVLINLYISYHDLLLPGLDLGVGVYNLLGEKNYYLQPYLGGHAPLPGEPREFIGRVTYTYTFAHR